mmetsp:Transcript_8637/g.13118  ORF Transcript_8637/g.13118 Transcript_8637/m.13118 type:complete len:499 (-) Transcript_8637:850-2346(-)|eukprot:CAMPEP_0201520344 /NCGR_PEP_ID=MMETSP0161_2-20130828/10654_1 /ASSEMBLY_ACC=CAM_ASM_000251 /TAXON_ID=180227 /ORGANISM="Neoparamoeba aestuarina, Strain SoJaBio B1-5/56/2" /LENGTH=498 /DNA_ID=CAMNT_0047918665 /DNA_START=68 /DNA_END=1564 /DNA_ORIENTATION=+
MLGNLSRCLWGGRGLLSQGQKAFFSSSVSSSTIHNPPREQGVLTLDSLREKVDKDEIDTVCMMVPDQFGRLMGKRLDARWFLESQASGSHFCNYLLTADINLVPQSGFLYSSWEGGYGDFHAVPDFNTLRQCGWIPGSAVILCDIKAEADYVSVAPRSVLRDQMREAQDLGFDPMAVVELEYYIFNGSYRDNFKRDYKGLDPRGHYVEDYHMLQGSRNEDLNRDARRCLRATGIPVEGTKGEAGVGQHELNIHYSDALTAADHAVLYKQCFKELADQKNLSVTFMAKPTQSDSGNSGHIHMSLVDKNTGVNIFEGKELLQGYKGTRVHSSDEFRWFLGGWLHHMPELMLFYAPTINSYKRYVTSSWAPTKLAWSIDNRTAGFRVVGRGQSLRIENRIPGADCNPYLAFAASIASGLDGIRNKIEPPPQFQGDVYEATDLPNVPRTLDEALHLFKNSEFAVDAFGSDVVHHYARHAQLEVENYKSAVTDWELKRYFEQI